MKGCWYICQACTTPCILFVGYIVRPHDPPDLCINGCSPASAHWEKLSAYYNVVTKLLQSPTAANKETLNVIL